MASSVEFHDVRFPTDVAFGSSGGPGRSTEIVTLGSGHEQRNQRWAHSRRRFDAGYGIKDLDTLHKVMAFYEARRGPLHGFRFRDPLDWKSCAPLQAVQPTDQVIGTGDGVSRNFRLVKTYGEPECAYQREIAKPEEGSVRVAVDGAEKVLDFDYTVDSDTGGIMFSEAVTPAPGIVVTAGFQFDVPVRFASDQLTVSLAAFTAGDVPSIELLEIRL